MGITLDAIIEYRKLQEGYSYKNYIIKITDSGYAVIDGRTKKVILITSSEKEAEEYIDSLKEAYETDVYKKNTDSVKYGVFTYDDELIYKTPSKREAFLSVREFREMDKESTGKKNRYKVKELSESQKRQKAKYK